MMKYSVLKFRSSDIQDWQKDLLVAALGDIGFEAFEEGENGFDAYIPSAQYSKVNVDSVLLEMEDGYAIDYTKEEVTPKNWNLEWESNFHPIFIGDTCYVRATFHPERPEYPYEIIIDPKMAFGTGHHQTTAMMLTYILEKEMEGKRVLDMGCGTGILAILAAKRKAKEIIAIDIAEESVKSVEENKTLNNVDNIHTFMGSTEKIGDRKFDVLLANINRNILLDHLVIYEDCLEAGGEMFLSGFYEREDLDIIIEKAEKLNFTYIDHKADENWCAARFVKK